MNNDNAVVVPLANAAEKKKRERSPVPHHVRQDERNFYIGVVNLMFSSWLIGYSPWCYWIYHLIKISVLITIRLVRGWGTPKAFFVLEYCYVINFYLIVYYLLSVCSAYSPYVGYSLRTIDYIAPTIFRIAFSSVVGPLAMSIAVFRNSLVFHSADQIIILAVHLSSNISIWGMRWWPMQLQGSFPDLFNIGCLEHSPANQLNLFYSSSQDCSGKFSDLLGWPIFVYVVMWAVPYYFFFFVLAKGSIEKGGYITMYEDMVKTNPLVKAATNIGGECFPHLKYMIGHGSICCCTFLMGPLLWHSFALHTIYLASMVSISVFNGGSFYFEVFAKKYARDHYLPLPPPPPAAAAGGGEAVADEEGLSLSLDATPAAAAVAAPVSTERCVIS